MATALVARRRFAAAPTIAVVAAAIGIWATAGGHRAALPSSEHLSVPSIDPTVVVIDRPDAARALDQLATAGIGDIDVLIARSASRAGREAVRALHERHSVARVLAPTALGGLVPYSAVTGSTPVGDLVVDAIGERLSVSPEVASP